MNNCSLLVASGSSSLCLTAFSQEGAGAGVARLGLQLEWKYLKVTAAAPQLYMESPFPP